MSFDLAVWYEPMPLSGAEARQKLHLAGKGDKSSFLPHPNVLAFHKALLERYPALESLDDDDERSVWSVTPAPSDRLIVINMMFSAPSAVIDTIVDLAEQLDLVVLDPQDDSVYLPTRLNRTLRLVVRPGPNVTNPEADVVEYRLRKALRSGGHAILESEAQRYVQAASGVGAGMQSSSGYAVEYRDGSAAANFRYETADLGLVVAIFQAFARDDNEPKSLVSWQQYG